MHWTFLHVSMHTVAHHPEMNSVTQVMWLNQAVVDYQKLVLSLESIEGRFCNHSVSGFLHPFLELLSLAVQDGDIIQGEDMSTMGQMFMTMW